MNLDWYLGRSGAHHTYLIDIFAKNIHLISGNEDMVDSEDQE
jgi:hypothetical protein